MTSFNTIWRVDMRLSHDGIGTSIDTVAVQAEDAMEAIEIAHKWYRRTPPGVVVKVELVSEKFIKE